MAIGFVGAGAKALASVINAIIQVTNGYANSGPAVATNYNATETIAVSLNVPVVLGHKYLVSARLDGVQNTATGTVRVPIRNTGAAGPVFNVPIVSGSYASAAVVFGAGSFLYVPTSTGTEGFVVTVVTSAGVVTVSANGVQLSVQDLGV